MTTSSAITVDAGYGPQPNAYFDRDGSGTPVLFVHGLGNAASNFEDTLAAHALADHRLIGLDLPGCGASPYPRHRNIRIRDLGDRADDRNLPLG